MKDSKKKIFFLIGTLNLDGASVWIHSLIKNIDRDRFEPVVCVFVHIVHGSRIDSMVKEMNCAVIEMNAPHHKVAPIHLFKLFSLLKKMEPSLIVNSNIQLASLVRFCSRALNIPTISVQHSVYGRHKRIIKFLESKTIHLSEKIICVSKGVCDSFCSVIGKEQLVTIENAVDIDEPLLAPADKQLLRRQLSLADNDRVYLCIARLHPQKNHEELIYAFSQFVQTHGSHKKLVLVGWGSLHKQLLSLIKKIDMESNIFLLGARDDVYQLYQISDFFILPSLNEGFGIVVVEAMHFGLPPLLTDLAPFREIADAESAIFAKGFDRDHLFELLQQSHCITDAVYSSMSKTSQHITAAKYSGAKMAQQYEQVFEKVINDRLVLL